MFRVLVVLHLLFGGAAAFTRLPLALPPVVKAHDLRGDTLLTTVRRGPGGEVLERRSLTDLTKRDRLVVTGGFAQFARLLDDSFEIVSCVQGSKESTVFLHDKVVCASSVGYVDLCTSGSTIVALEKDATLGWFDTRKTTGESVALSGTSPPCCINHHRGLTLVGYHDGSISVVSELSKKVLNSCQPSTSAVTSLARTRSYLGVATVYSSHVDGSVYQLTVETESGAVTSVHERVAPTGSGEFTTSLAASSMFLARTTLGGRVYLGSLFDQTTERALDLRCAQPALVSESHLTVATCANMLVWTL